NGPMAESVMESGIVDHQRVDAFRYQPPKPVDWLVCDVVEQPIRIAALIAKWLTSGWCRYTIFNLKLPMKKRYAEVQRCLELISQQLTAAGLPFTVKAKQLYHDREEVTVFIAITE
ncbi:MAG: 23S rRNA (cytidine2498-2'-O)-methyltransferase, partial [Halothiobacillaceae bacterium]